VQFQYIFMHVIENRKLIRRVLSTEFQDLEEGREKRRLEKFFKKICLEVYIEILLKYT